MPLNLKVRDKVLVLSCNMRSFCLKRKLDRKYIRLGTIIAQYSLLAFKVNLSKLSNIYLVFYTSLLEPYSLNRTILHLDTLIIDTLREYSDDVYKVEKIINCRQNENNQQEYLVKQTSYLKEENLQEPRLNILAKALKQFQDSKGI